MSRDQEGLSPVLPKDRGVKEEKGAENGWEDTERHPHPFSATEKLSSGSTDARKAIFISCFLVGDRCGGTRAHLDSAEGLSRGV